jgi:hypothetical protein
MSNRKIKKVGDLKDAGNVRKYAWDCVSFDHPKQSSLMITP